MPLSIRRLLAVSLIAGALLAAACGGEDRPEVDVIDSGSGSSSGSVSGSVSASGAPAPSQSGQSASSDRYVTVSNVDVYFAMALDLRDMRNLMQPATQGQPVDWSAITAIYEDGKNQLRADGTGRTLASIPNDTVQAVFPDGASVYGRTGFIDALIRDGLNGTGRAQGLSDDARRQIVDKGVQMLIYGKALQELEAAKTRVSQGNLDNTSGAPHALDEAWGAIAGAPDNDAVRSYSLLQTATGREGNFNLAGKIRDPLETAFVAALQAAQKGDTAAFDKAYSDIKGHLNAIFYLGALRYVKTLEGDGTEAQRQVHLAEGWTFYQTIRATVASASPSAAQTVESAYNRTAAEAFPANLTTDVYAALNEPAVLQALGIPSELVVRTPPQ